MRRREPIRSIGWGEMCSNCKMRSCCSEEISNKLYEIAYERDENGCYLEPSERVRLAAAEALRVCCPGRDEDFIIERGPPPVRGGGEQPGVVPESGGYWAEATSSAAPMAINGASVRRARLRHLDVLTIGRGIDLIFLDAPAG